jgi:prolipoprotein diacylglyceryltransferase
MKMIEFSSRGVSIFGFEIYFYGLIIVCGILVALLVINTLMKRLKMNTDNLFLFAIFVVPLTV